MEKRPAQKEKNAPTFSVVSENRVTAYLLCFRHVVCGRLLVAKARLLLSLSCQNTGYLIRYGRDR